MAVIDEVVALEEALKKAKWAALEARSKVRKLADSLQAAERRLVGVKKNLETCKGALAKAKAPVVVSLYTEGVDKPTKGEYVKYKLLVDQNEELVERINAEISSLRTQIKTSEADLPALDEEVKRVEKKLGQYGVVKEFKRG